MLVAVDAGRSYVKAITSNGREYKTLLFPSWITPYYKTEWDVLTSDSDYVIEYKGEKHYIGEVVEFVADGDSGRRMNEEKGGKNTLLFILAALFRLGRTYEPIDLVTGVPLNRFNSDKDKVKNMLVGAHDVALIGKHGKESRRIVIRNCSVAVEGAGAFFDEPTDDECHVIDLGSRTVNCLTFRRKRFMAPSSFTLPWGWDTLREENQNAARIAETLFGQLSAKWNKDNPVKVVGGKAEELTPELQKYFPRAVCIENPQFANARGYYKMGVVAGYK